MADRYIWQGENWCEFSWDNKELEPKLAVAKQRFDILLEQADVLDLKERGELLVNEAIATSIIEGEPLDHDSIRSSVARRMGLPTAGLPEVKRDEDGLVELLIDAVSNFTKPLTAERLWGWQAALFPSGHSGIYKIKVGGWRTGAEAMQVVSVSMKKVVVHYEAPPSLLVAEQMNSFLRWWNTDDTDSNPLMRAAIAHFRFVTIHPFDDGNGRIARALSDMALAQGEKTGLRLYSLSLEILNNKSSYYNILEETQKGEGDLTIWLSWFIDMFQSAVDNSLSIIKKSRFLGRYYRSLAEIPLNERQMKAIAKLLECYPAEFKGGLTNKKYVSMTKISPETAKRDLKDLVDKGLLLPGPARGRSVSYQLSVIK